MSTVFNLLNILHLVQLLMICWRVRLSEHLDQFYWLLEQAATEINRFVYKVRGSLTVPKQELSYNSKSSNKAQKLQTYSD